MFKFMFTILLLVSLSACASDQAYQSYATAYSAYANRSVSQAKACEINTTENATLPKGFNLICYQGNSTANFAPPQQIKDSEWTGPVQKFISGMGIVGGLAVQGWSNYRMIDSVGKSAGGNIAIADSYNSSTSNTATDSFNTTTNTETNSGTFDSYNGNYRDWSDRHDVTNP